MNQPAITARPFLSVIVATAGHRPGTLLRTLVSLVNEPGTWWEAVVSGDGTAAHLPLLRALNDPRLVGVATAYRDKAAATRNAAIRASRGEVLAYLDDDDWALPGHLAHLARPFWDDDGLKAAFGRSWGVVPFTVSDGEALDLVTARDEIFSQPTDAVDPALVAAGRVGLFPPPYWTASSLGAFCPWTSCAVVHRRECLMRVGFMDETLKLLEDWDLWARIGREYRWCDLGGPPTSVYSIGSPESVTSVASREAKARTTKEVRRRARCG